MKVKLTGKAFLFLLALCGPAYAAAEGAGVSGMIEQMAELVVQLGVIIFAAWAGGAVFRRMKLPDVLGEILSGTLIGPYLLGSVPLPGFTHGIFPVLPGFPVSPELYMFVGLASIVLLFHVGLETDIDTLFRFSVTGLVVGLGGVIASFLAGDLLTVFCSERFFGVRYAIMDPIPLFLGVISTATSVGITARILSERHKMNSPEGVTIISGAVIDDVLGIIVLAITVGIARSGHVEWKQIGMIGAKAVAIWLGFTVVGIACAKYIGKFLHTFKDKDTITVISLALALLLAGLFERSGLAMIIGAYIMGLSLSKTDLSFLLQRNLSVIQRLLIPIFFCIMGMLVDLRSLGSGHILVFGLIYTLLAVISKMIGCGVPALFMNFTVRGAARVGVGMVPRGEVALIVTGIGLAAGVLTGELFSVAIIMTFLTTLITPPILAMLLDSDKPSLRKQPDREDDHHEIIYKMPNPETAELILNKVVGAFESEGFYVYPIDTSDKLYYHVCKDDIVVVMKYSAEQISFECSPRHAPFIHMLFYEVMAELERVMKNLQGLTDAEEIGKKIFEGEAPPEHVNGKNPIAKYLHPLSISLSLRGTDKKEIIGELVDLLTLSGQLNQQFRDQVAADVYDRETAMSTGMQDGIALPHAKSAAVSKMVCAVGLHRQGVDFTSIDGKRSTIFVLIVAPKDSPESYLQLMAEVSRFLSVPENIAQVLACKKKDTLYEILTQK